MVDDPRDEENVDPAFPGNPDEPVEGAEDLPEDVRDGDVTEEE